MTFSKEQETLFRFCDSLVVNPELMSTKLGGKLKGVQHEPEVIWANIVAAGMEQPSKFFRLLMAWYRASLGEDEARDKFIAMAMKNPNRIGQEVLLRRLWDSMNRDDLPDDWKDVFQGKFK